MIKGDTVYLNSGSSPMKVLAIFDRYEGPGAPAIKCAEVKYEKVTGGWWGIQKLEMATEVFPVDCLTMKKPR